MSDEQGAIPEGKVLAGYVRGIATVIRAFPNDCAWGGPDQAELAAATLDHAYAALATPKPPVDAGAMRERCALVTDEMWGEGPSGSYDNGATADGWNMACSEIAKRIRNLSDDGETM